MSDVYSRLGLKPMSETMCGVDGDATEFNTGRVYRHNGHTSEVSMPQYSDACVGHTIRMAMRDDIHLERKEVMARDRIFCLIDEKADLQAALMELDTEGKYASLYANVQQKRTAEGERNYD